MTSAQIYPWLQGLGTIVLGCFGTFTLAASLLLLLALSPFPFFVIGGLQGTARNFLGAGLGAVSGALWLAGAVLCWRGPWQRASGVSLAGVACFVLGTLLLKPGSV